MPQGRIAQRQASCAKKNLMVGDHLAVDSARHHAATYMDSGPCPPFYLTAHEKAAPRRVNSVSA
jgi:hypothetical protein